MRFAESTMAAGLFLLAIGLTSAGTADDIDSGEIRLCIPSLRTDNRTINDAYRIAIGDLVGNVQPFQSGLLERPVPVILAGLDYGRPWTRDASINAWNGASLIMPQVARDTLLSVLDRTEGRCAHWRAVLGLHRLGHRSLASLSVHRRPGIPGSGIRGDEELAGVFREDGIRPPRTTSFVALVGATALPDIQSSMPTAAAPVRSSTGPSVIRTRCRGRDTASR